MATATRHKRAQGTKGPPFLDNGDNLTQPEFHRRYVLCSEEAKAELVGGVVYLASPISRLHAKYQLHLACAFGLYEEATPGVEALDNATTILGKRSEPQPDLALRILTEWGGQSRTDEDEYVMGGPELLGEIAHSTRSLDLGRKMEDYKNAGVLEYLVVCVGERELHWFNLKSGRKISPNAQGVYRSRVFPGLWLDGGALLARRLSQLLRVLREGLASPEHAAFVKRLAAARRRK